jgi:hypothetical protein
MRSARFGFREEPAKPVAPPVARASRMPLLACRDCGFRGPVTLYRGGSSSETAYLCDECRGAISLDAFSCGEEDSLIPHKNLMGVK